PGFGFGKSKEHNYTLLKGLDKLRETGCPLLVGISRKSMIYKLLDISPEEALSATSALHMAALLNGAKILRVHDVKEACQVIKLAEALMNQQD
ncbi:MAG: dihydropteroate synthase, partial [Bacteroidota bacterium]